MKEQNIRAYGEHVLLQKDESKMHGILHLPDSISALSPMSRVLSAGDKVPEGFFFKGMRVIAKTFIQDRKQNAITLESKEGIKMNCFFTHWSNVLARHMRSRVIPYGRRVLVKRIMGKDRLSDTIELPEAAKENYQSLDVEVIRLGALLGQVRHFKLPIEPGMKCKLTRWEQHMVELGLPTGYHLIVNESDLEYYEC